MAALTMGGAGVASVASAQSNPTPRPETPAPRPDTQGRAPEAPVGHRQPRPQDLPQGLSRGEGVRIPENEALDKKLEICRGC